MSNVHSLSSRQVRLDATDKRKQALQSGDRSKARPTHIKRGDVDVPGLLAFTSITSS